MLSSSPRLNALLQQAKEAEARMTPRERKAMWREQAISWAYGETLMTRFEQGRADMTELEQKHLKQHIPEMFDRTH